VVTYAALALPLLGLLPAAAPGVGDVSPRIMQARAVSKCQPGAQQDAQDTAEAVPTRLHSPRPADRAQRQIDCRLNSTVQTISLVRLDTTHNHRPEGIRSWLALSGLSPSNAGGRSTRSSGCADTRWSDVAAGNRCAVLEQVMRAPVAPDNLDL